MARIIPYRGKQGREHGQWEFLQRSEIPAEYMLAHTSGDDEAIARDMRLEVLNQDQQANTNIVATMGEDEYFKMWDRIDKRGFFRNGEPTVEALRTYSGQMIRTSWIDKPHRSEEDKIYEECYQQALANDREQERTDRMVEKYQFLDKYKTIAEEVKKKNQWDKAQKDKRDKEIMTKATDLADSLAEDHKFNARQVYYLRKYIYRAMCASDTVSIPDAIDFAKLAK